MSGRLLAIATTVALAAVVAAAAPVRGATVNLEVNSASDPTPVFDGTVTTLPHAVDGSDGSDTHPCSGPNGSAASATATGALDDAMRAAGIPWRGNWDPGIPRLLRRPHRSLRLGRARPLLVSDDQRPLRQRRLPGAGRRRRLGPLLLRPAVRRPRPGGSRRRRGSGGTAGRQPVDSGEGEPPPVSPRRLAVRAAAYLRRSGDAAGADWGGWRWPCGEATGPAGPPAALLGGGLSQSRDGSLGGDVNATALAVLAQGEPRPETLGGPLAGSPRSRPPVVASASGRELRPTSTPPASPSGPWPGRGCGSRRGAAPPSCARLRGPTVASRPSR